MVKIENLNSSGTLTPEILIKQWLNGIKIGHIAHQRVAVRYTFLGRMLGIPVTIFTIIIGTSIFGALTSSENQWILIFTGIISVIAAILSGLQTFLKYPDIAHKHYTFGMKYGILRRSEVYRLCEKYENVEFFHVGRSSPYIERCDELCNDQLDEEGFKK